jgi:hypothetical protein
MKHRFRVEKTVRVQLTSKFCNVLIGQRAYKIEFEQATFQSFYTLYNEKANFPSKIPSNLRNQ